jgi:hypothetical protein
MPALARCLAILSIAGFAVPAAADTWTKVTDVGPDPIARTFRQQYDFSATGRVEVRNIGNSVEIKAADGNAVELAYERRAATQQDFDCETLEVEHRKDELRIWVKHKKGRACRMIRADDHLTLTVPRGAAVTVREVGSKVAVSGVTGLVRLSDIGDDATLSDAQQVEASDIGDRLELHVVRLGPAGIRVSDVGDTVELNLPEKIDARLRIAGVGDEIRGPGLRLDTDEDERSFETVLGQGGPLIRISDVGDTVVIRGPRLGD